MSRVRGCRKPLFPPHLGKIPFRMHAAMFATSVLPERFDICDVLDSDGKSVVPPVKDQGATGTCNPHRFCSAIKINAAVKGRPLSWDPSEADLYRSGLAIDRARNTPSGVELPALEDAGTLSEDLTLAMSETGVRARRIEKTSDGRDSDCEPDVTNADGTLTRKITAERTLLDLEDADERHIIIAPKHAIDPNATDAITQVRASVNAKIPVAIDVFVDMGFEEWTPEQPPRNTTNENDPQGGWHAMLIVGFEKNPNGVGYRFKVLNSWGVELGMKGFWLVGEGFVRRAGALIPCDMNFKEAA